MPAVNRPGNDSAGSGRRRPRLGREQAAGLVDSLLLILARVGANLLALAWTLLLVRLVQPELSGIAFRAIALAQIGSVLITLNVESGAMRVLVPALQQGRPDEAAGFIRFNRRMVWLSAPALALAALAWQQFRGDGALVLWIAVAAVMVALARLTARHATALGAMRRGLLPRLLTGPLVLTVGLGLAWLGGIDLQPWHVAALFALSEALTVLIQQRLLRATFAPLTGRPAPADGWRGWIALGLWLSPGLMMSEYRKALLIATAAWVLAPAELSLFAVAFSIINIINFGVVAVDVAFSPRIARAMAANQPARRDHLLAVAAAIKLAGLGLGIAGTLLIEPWLLGRFGADYRAAWPALLILLALPASAILFGPASVVLAARGLGRADCFGNMLGGLAIILAILAGGALSGLTGVALGAVLGQTLALAIMALQCRRLLGIDPTLIGLRHLRSPSAAPATEAVP
ncbi:MAG: lipopolysaccharide biosynthesis protein [Paracoccus sp. (in: a-proteobacteria)]